MTKFSKILTVFVTIASLVFVGFAIAATFGGPDWRSVMSEEYFDGYTFSRSDGPEPIWSATRAVDGQQVASSKALPEVLTKVMDEIEQQRQTELQQIREREPFLQQRIERLGPRIQSDQAALDAYVTDLRNRLSQLRNQESELTTRITGMAIEASKLETQVKSRREDVFRLNQQVQELQADLFRLQEIRRQLRDIDYQLKSQLDRVDKRQQLLKNDLPADSTT